MTDLPGDIGGSNPLKIWLNKIKTAIKRRTLLPGLGYKLHQHESGVALEILNPGGGTSPGGGMNWRGEFTLTPLSSYNLYDVVKISTGASAGAYLAVVTNPSQPPWTGIGWVQIASGDTNGDWG